MECESLGGSTERAHGLPLPRRWIGDDVLEKLRIQTVLLERHGIGDPIGASLPGFHRKGNGQPEVDRDDAISVEFNDRARFCCPPADGLSPSVLRKLDRAPFDLSRYGKGGRKRTLFDCLGQGCCIDLALVLCGLLSFLRIEEVRRRNCQKGHRRPHGKRLDDRDLRLLGLKVFIVGGFQLVDLLLRQSGLGKVLLRDL